VRAALRKLIASRELSVRALLGLCEVDEPTERVVIGVDANLGWPEAFRDHIQGRGTGYVPAEPGEMNNALAYRLCERVVFHRCGKKPLSAPFDRMGNTTTKAIIGCALLQEADAASVLPFDCDRGTVAVVEAYPALWKVGNRKDSSLVAEAQATLAHCRLPPPGTDELDAVLAALTAACYDNQSRGLRLRLPVLRTPEDYLAAGAGPLDSATIHSEGWVFYPVCAERP
jgi:hypothetical protein